jgi:hypothetical protein
VVRQGGRRQPDPPGDLARRQAARPFLDEKAKHLQPVLLSERGESSNGSAIFHISTILKLIARVNEAETFTQSIARGDEAAPHSCDT